MFFKELDPNEIDICYNIFDILEERSTVEIDVGGNAFFNNFKYMEKILRKHLAGNNNIKKEDLLYFNDLLKNTKNEQIKTVFFAAMAQNENTPNEIFIDMFNNIDSFESQKCKNIVLRSCAKIIEKRGNLMPMFIELVNEKASERTKKDIINYLILTLKDPELLKNFLKNIENIGFNEAKMYGDENYNISKETLVPLVNIINKNNNEEERIISFLKIIETVDKIDKATLLKMVNSVGNINQLLSQKEKFYTKLFKRLKNPNFIDSNNKIEKDECILAAIDSLEKMQDDLTKKTIYFGMTLCATNLNQDALAKIYNNTKNYEDEFTKTLIFSGIIENKETNLRTIKEIAENTDNFKDEDFKEMIFEKILENKKLSNALLTEIKVFVNKIEDEDTKANLTKKINERKTTNTLSCRTSF